MKPLLPIADDDSSLMATVRGMETKARGMVANLNQFKPTIALGADARLSYVLAEDPNEQTTEDYPRGYARPILDTGAPVALRIAQINAKALKIHAALSPFMTLDLPGQNTDSMQAHAAPLGFVSVRGCDLCWNGSVWETTLGLLPFSAHFDGAEDVVIPRQEFPAKTGMLFLEFNVSYAVNGTLKIAGETLRFEPAITNQCSISYAPDAGWSAGKIVSPLAWGEVPTKEFIAPVVLRVGNGEFPTSHVFMRPDGGGRVSPTE